MFVHDHDMGFALGWFHESLATLAAPLVNITWPRCAF